ncbi:alkaline phosphatase family protein [Isoptericola sp. b441]|uniref:Alkaline phosphatase family protein n=1 Tax=Actinotalea lenta TaxID=3064654 RepID=A0ABT9DAL4_9CELL|nr:MULTISPECIES: nucleotide pyrophosphatase/phosphodiesterase family protein [unclassified Isoptericola]MDO8107925.1 alkaline phosphatase family protein [Isoptericola sp. b441]MDO8120408.1 alkaline phosphatase family protein [Isoptericola sp. b490]
MTLDLAERGLVGPDPGGCSLGEVLPAAAGVLGLDLPGGWAGSAARARSRFDLPQADRVCVVLVDGLGLLQLRERAGHAAFLRGRLPEARELVCGYPSTTAASMGLLGTGRAAGRTGLVGYTVRNPRTGRLANLVSWDGADEPEAWQREPNLTRLVAEQDVAVTSVGPPEFRGSGLTRAALGGGRYISAVAWEDRVDGALRALREPGLVYLYCGDVDKAGHQHGWRSAQWGDALSELDRGLGRLARGMPAGTVLLVTADHGQVEIDPADLVDVGSVPELARDVELVAGEPRAAAVHVASGADPAGVATRWREVLGDRALVVTRAEAIDLGWYGDVAAHVEPMLGDLVVAALGRAGVADSRTQTPHSLTLRGMHGSLTPDEMRVPLLVA